MHLPILSLLIKTLALETGFFMGTVAEGLVLGGTAAAQRVVVFGCDFGAVEFDAAAHVQRSVFGDEDFLFGEKIVDQLVVDLVGQRAGGTFADGRDDLLFAFGVGQALEVLDYEGAFSGISMVDFSSLMRLLL
jgi:hypothetical protein